MSSKAYPGPYFTGNSQVISNNVYALQEGGHQVIILSIGCGKPTGMVYDNQDELIDPECLKATAKLMAASWNMSEVIQKAIKVLTPDNESQDSNDRWIEIEVLIQELKKALPHGA